MDTKVSKHEVRGGWLCGNRGSPFLQRPTDHTPAILSLQTLGPDHRLGSGQWGLHPGCHHPQLGTFSCITLTVSPQHFRMELPPCPQAADCPFLLSPPSTWQSRSQV